MASQERSEQLIPDKEGVTFLLFNPERETVILEKRHRSDPTYGGLTIIPGGKIKTGETETDTLIREIREEFGRKVKILLTSYLGDAYSIAKNGELHLSHSYLVLYKGQVNNEEGQTIIVCDIKEAEKVVPLGSSKLTIRRATDFLSRQNG